MNRISLAFYLGSLCISSLIPVFGEELFSAKEVQDFVNSSGISSDGEKFLVLQGRFLNSARKFPYDPKKKYKLTCTVRLVSGSKGLAYLGLTPFDAAGKRIFSQTINALPKSFTTLAAAAEKGATTLSLTDGSKWDNKTPYGFVVFNADEKFADLPNFTGVPMVKESVTQKDGTWTVQLKKPLNKQYEAGTAVRQHCASDFLIYGARKNLTGMPGPLCEALPFSRLVKFRNEFRKPDPGCLFS